MDQQLNQLPSGFFTLCKNYKIVSINQTLLNLLGYKTEHIIGREIEAILPSTGRAFIQLFFYPLISKNKRVNEISLDFQAKNGSIIPVLISASQETNGMVSCVTFPIQERNRYVNQLVGAKQEAQEQLEEVHDQNSRLNSNLLELKEKQRQLVKANEQNEKFNVETQKQLALAKKIQHATLTSDLNYEKLKTQSYYQASSSLSGDIYGLYPINDHQYGIILLDVMGHGLSSSLITMSLESLFQRLISRGYATDQVIKELDDHLHSFFHKNEEAWHYCTAIYLFIDTNRKTIEYINAGHPPALFVDDEGELKELKSSAPPLGTFEGIEYKTNCISYQKGARILLYTDGVSESLPDDYLTFFLKEKPVKEIAESKTNLVERLNDEKNTKKDDQCFILIEVK